MGTWAPPSALGNLMAQVRLLTQRKVTNGEIMHLFSLQTKAEVGQAWASEGAAHRVISCRLWKGWFRWTCAREQAAAWQQLQVPLSLTHTHGILTAQGQRLRHSGILQRLQHWMEPSMKTHQCIDLHFLHLCRLVDHRGQNWERQPWQWDINHTLSTPPTRWTKT